MVDAFVFVGRSSVHHHITWRAEHEIAHAGGPLGVPRRRQKHEQARLGQQVSEDVGFERPQELLRPITGKGEIEDARPISGGGVRKRLRQRLGIRHTLAKRHRIPEERNARARWRRDHLAVAELIDRIFNIVNDAPCLSVEFSIMEHAGMPGPPPENRVRRQIARRTDFDRGRRRDQGIGLRDGQAQDNGGDDHEGVAQAPSNHNRGKHGSGEAQRQFVEPIPMAPRQSAYEQASGAEDQQADNFGDRTRR